MSSGDRPKTPLPKGKRFGRYLLLDRIGRGGMAEVYRALAHGPEGFQRRFVIKRIRKEKAESRDFVDMFVNEARISALLEHPNIVQVYDFGEVDGDYYLAMEYLRGHDLLALLAYLHGNHLKLPVEVACFVATEIARGLDHAHSLQSGGKSLGIVHRDVTPSNVMLLNTGGVKLLDFGIARATMKLRSTTPAGGLIKGKLSYLSPEQVRGTEADARTDVWALGVVLWETLVGRRLFWNNNDLEVMRNVLQKHISRPSSHRTDVPPELDDVVMRAMARDPAERFQSAGDLASALQSVPVDMSRARETLSTLLTDCFGTGSLDAGPLPEETPLTEPTVPMLVMSAPANDAKDHDPQDAGDPVPDKFSGEEDYSVVSSVRPIADLRPPPRWRSGFLAGAAAVGLLLSAGYSAQPYLDTIGIDLPFRESSAVPGQIGDVAAAADRVATEGDPAQDRTAGTDDIGQQIAEAVAVPTALSEATEHSPGGPALEPAGAGETALAPEEAAAEHKRDPGERRVSRRGGRSRAGAVALPAAILEVRDRGLAAAAEGRNQTARVALEEVVNAGGGDARVFLALANVEFDLGNYARARDLATRAAALSPRGVRDYLLIGDASFKLGDNPAAIEAYKKALALNPDDASIAARLSRVQSR